MEVCLGFPVVTVEECDLLERPVGQVDFWKDGFRDFIRPYEIKTYRIRTK